MSTMRRPDEGRPDEVVYDLGPVTIQTRQLPDGPWSEPIRVTGLKISLDKTAVGSNQEPSPSSPTNQPNQP